MTQECILSTVWYVTLPKAYFKSKQQDYAEKHNFVLLHCNIWTMHFNLQYESILFVFFLFKFRYI